MGDMITNSLVLAVNSVYCIRSMGSSGTGDALQECNAMIMQTKPESVSKVKVFQKGMSNANTCDTKMITITRTSCDIK